MECVYWENLIWLEELSPTKTLVFWKLLYGRLPIDLEAKEKEWFYALSVLCVVIMLNLFLIWSFIILLLYTDVEMTKGSFSNFTMFFFEFGCLVYEVFL